MAEEKKLKKSREPGESSSPPAPSPFSPDLWGASRGDRTASRAISYWFVFLLLFVLSAGSLDRDWASGEEVHLALETTATVLAFVVGFLALVRFYSKRKKTFLFIGTGFLGTGFLDLFHASTSLVGRGGLSSLELQNRSAWSFTASAGFLSVFLFVSWLAWKWEDQRKDGEEIRDSQVFLTAAVLTVLIFLAFFRLPPTQAIYPGAFLSRPGELFPALFFFLALTGYLTKGGWRTNGFEHWLVMALLISAMAHGGLMAFAGLAHDLDYDLAHLLKILAYGCVLVGLMASVFTTFRREEEAAQAARAANAALAREIDTRRKAERILQDNEEELQDFLDNAHDLIQSVDPQGRFLYVNQAWKKVLGYNDQDLEDLTLFEILHDSCRDRCIRDFRKVLEGTALPSVEVNFRAKDGRVVFCSGSANARFQEGEPVATRSIFRDISESLETRRELEGYQANLQALVENTGDAIWSVNRDLQLITFNTAFSMALEARTGKEPGAAGLPEEVYPPEDAAWYRAMYQRALRGEAFSELRDEEIGGQIRSYELFFNPIREAMGITGVAVFGKDVTARRRAQLALRMAKEEAERANQAKSHFLANMSHELRTPLNSVIGFTNILLKNRSGNLQEKELGFLERISANGRHLLELINEVLDLAKIEAGRMELEFRKVDLRELIHETLTQMEGQVRAKNLVLQARIPPHLPELETDPGKLKQVLINLVGNALKFTEAGEVTVEVTTLSDGRTPSSIRVRDTGIGIPPDRLQAIFEAFQQADGTTSRRFGGTGLGLTISRSLCQLLGYDLKVESRVAKGSTFTILLSERHPAAEGAQEGEGEGERPVRPPASAGRRRKKEGGDKGAAARAEAHGRRGPPRRVLVIDDDGDSRMLLTHLLEDMDCSVATASSAEEGLSKARGWSPHLITLDLLMPGVTGWEVMRKLKEDPELRSIPVVVVSMVAGEEEHSNLLGAVDLLTKPVNREDLTRVLDRNLFLARDRVALVVEDDPDTRTVVRTYLEEMGLRVLVAENGADAEIRMEEDRPDIILLDLVMPEMDGLTFLGRLREREDGMGLPVIVCTEKELSREERSRLQTRASEVVTKGKSLEKDLREILQLFFPVDRGKGDA